MGRESSFVVRIIINYKNNKFSGEETEQNFL